MRAGWAGRSLGVREAPSAHLADPGVELARRLVVERDDRALALQFLAQRVVLVVAEDRLPHPVPLVGDHELDLVLREELREREGGMGLSARLAACGRRVQLWRTVTRLVENSRSSLSFW